MAGSKTAAARTAVPDRPTAAAISRALAAWYDRHRRDLPWRRSRDPYRVWVSEIMLQQTQVDRVTDFFTRFVARFPTVDELAAAAEADVLRLWEGLGYYRRARQLLAAARQVVAEHGGRFPASVAGLRGLPGVGRYTAGAVASIAFGLPEPIVEANSRRVLARLVAHAAPLTGPAGDEPLWQVAAALVPRRQPGRFNQALMELGALVCTPTRPACDRCPLRGVCAAHRLGRTASIPARAPRPQAVQRRETAVVARRRGRVLVVRRGPDEWWTGLWDFPRVPGTAARFCRDGRWGDAPRHPLNGLDCEDPRRLGRLVHGVTHHRIVLEIVTCRVRGGPRAGAACKWLPLAALDALAMTAPGRRIAHLVAAAGDTLA